MGSSLSFETDSGFTLVELLIATALGVLVLAAVAAVLAGGLRVWDRASGNPSALQDATLALEWLQRDLHNTTATRQMAFEGAPDSLRFPARIGASGQTSAPPRLVRVVYSVDLGRRTLERTCVGLLGLENGADSETLLNGIESIRFSYLSGPSGGAGQWVTVWSTPTNQPAAVNVWLRLTPARGGLEIHRTIAIPSS